ncbi:MAG TPA: YtxH domain-containing protein [Anaerolineaceae bacterium]
MEMHESNSMNPVVAFLIGGVIGAAVMLILAPQSGSDTRHLLASRTQEIKNRAVESSTKTGKAVGELVSGARDRATNIFRRGEDMATSIKSNIEDEAKSKSTLYG